MNIAQGEGEARWHCRQLENDSLLSPPPYWSIKYTPWRHPYADRCLPSVILSTPQAEAPVAWLGGLPGPHPSWAAASIPPQLSHWLGSGLPLRPCPLLWQPTSLPIYPQLQADGAGTTAVQVVGFYKVTSRPETAD